MLSDALATATAISAIATTHQREASSRVLSLLSRNSKGLTTFSARMEAGASKAPLHVLNTAEISAPKNTPCNQTGVWRATNRINVSCWSPSSNCGSSWNVISANNSGSYSNSVQGVGDANGDGTLDRPFHCVWVASSLDPKLANWNVQQITNGQRDAINEVVSGNSTGTAFSLGMAGRPCGPAARRG